MSDMLRNKKPNPIITELFIRGSPAGKYWTKGRPWKANSNLPQDVLRTYSGHPIEVLQNT